MSKSLVVAAMSGGVDSAVAAGLLVEAGYTVVGVTMKMYEAKRASYARSCCGSEDFDDARRSASILGIPHYVLDYTKEFKRGVIDHFVQEYERGRTPNPCVSCNNHVKLGTLRRYAASLGANFLATGHYAQLIHAADGPHLFYSNNPKDQAYALAGLRREQLAQLLLPLGTQSKETTRRVARRLGLPVSEKAESQDICFVEGGDYRDILSENHAHQPQIPGELRSLDGTLLGLHTGITSYTVGQRARLGGATEAWYVLRIVPSTHTIILGHKEDLNAQDLSAEAPNLLQAEHFLEPVRVKAMIRSHAQPAAGLATYEMASETLKLRFDEPQPAITPGQLVVLLAPDTREVLASATIADQNAVS